MTRSANLRRSPAAQPTERGAPRRRFKAEERKAEIVAAAAQLFAERGFGGTTREIARRLGVTQALLYRHFQSKHALVEAVYAAAAAQRANDPPPLDLLQDRSQSLETRLAAFYQAYLRRANYVSLRLFARGALDGLETARRFSAPLTERVLRPLVAELRHEAGLPEFAARPMLRGERELAMALHGGVVFLNVRKYLYDMPMPEALDDLVALQVRAYLPGALAELRRLQSLPAADALAVRQLEPRRKRR